jgi:hypothetical protein
MPSPPIVLPPPSRKARPVTASGAITLRIERDALREAGRKAHERGSLDSVELAKLEAFCDEASLSAPVGETSIELSESDLVELVGEESFERDWVTVPFPIGGFSDSVRPTGVRHLSFRPAAPVGEVSAEWLGDSAIQEVPHEWLGESAVMDASLDEDLVTAGSIALRAPRVPSFEAELEPPTARPARDVAESVEVEACAWDDAEDPEHDAPLASLPPSLPPPAPLPELRFAPRVRAHAPAAEPSFVAWGAEPVVASPAPLSSAPITPSYDDLRAAPLPTPAAPLVGWMADLAPPAPRMSPAMAFAPTLPSAASMSASASGSAAGFAFAPVNPQTKMRALPEGAVKPATPEAASKMPPWAAPALFAAALVLGLAGEVWLAGRPAPTAEAPPAPAPVSAPAAQNAVAASTPAMVVVASPVR